LTDSPSENHAFSTRTEGDKDTHSVLASVGCLLGQSGTPDPLPQTGSRKNVPPETGRGTETPARTDGVPTDGQPLSRIVGRRDPGQVFRLEERGLEDALVPQPGDRRRAERRDPVEALDVTDLVDLDLGQNSPVGDQHHPRETESFPQFPDLACQRRGIGRVATEDLDGGTSAGGAQKPVNDLGQAFLAVPVVGTLGQTVAPRAVPDDTSSSTRVPSWRCFWARAASIFPGPTEGRPRHRRARLRWPRPHPGPLRAWKWPSRGTAPGKERDWRPVRSIGGRSGPPEGSAAGCVLNPGELSDPRQTRGAHHPDHGRHVPVGQGVDAGEIMRDHARSCEIMGQNAHGLPRHASLDHLENVGREDQKLATLSPLHILW